MTLMDAYKKFRNICIRKIPHIITSAFLVISYFGYRQCPQGSTYEIGYITYFTILSILCFVYEGFDAYFEYKKLYPSKSSRDLYAYTIISAFVSTMLFVSLSFIVLDGKPYSCYYAYNHVIAIISFVLSVVITVGISTIEHYIWSNLPDNYGQV